MAEVVKIIQGQDKTFRVKLRDKNGDPYDLTSNTEISACFMKADGTVLTVTKTSTAIVVASLIKGFIDVSLTDAETILLAVGEKQDFQVCVDYGTVKRCSIAKQLLTVEQTLC